MSTSTSTVRLQGRQFFLPGQLPIRATRTVVNGDVPMADRDFMQIILVVGGTATHRTIFGQQTISRGDAFVLRPGAWHAYEEAVGLDLYDCRFGLELLQGELAWTREDPAMELMFWAAPESLDRRGLLHVHLPEDSINRCAALMDELSDSTIKSSLTDSTTTSPEDSEYAARDHTNIDEISRLLGFVTEIGRELAASVHKIRKGKPEPHQAVSEAIRVMEEDIRRDWTLPELARRLKLDKSYLVRLFRAHTSAPPMQFLAKLRAERAALLLLRTRRDISAIGEQVGWNDPNYFARRFKAHFGISATKYRQQFAGSTSPAPEP